MPIDPVIAARLPLLDGIASFEQLIDDPSAGEARTRFEDDGAPYVAPEVPVRDVALTAEGHAFRARVYGRGGGASPALVWSHGGGFVGGSLEMNEADVVARELVRRTGGVVVSVDYSLVPAVTYPVPHRQVAEAYRWTLAEAAGLGVDPERVGMGGASAGGALTLAATRELIDHGQSPAFLTLAYPVAHRSWAPVPQVDALMAEVPALFRFPPETVSRMNDAYLGSAADPRYAFADQADLSVLPPALVVVCEYDDLRPSAERLVTELAAAGRPVERRLAAGMLHGHLNRTPALGEVDATLADIARVMREGQVHPG